MVGVSYRYKVQIFYETPRFSLVFQYYVLVAAS